MADIKRRQGRTSIDDEPVNSRLLSLPPELRITIYSYILEPDISLTTSLSILHICPLIRYEALPIYCKTLQTYNQTLRDAYMNAISSRPDADHEHLSASDILSFCKQGLLMGRLANSFPKDSFSDHEMRRFIREVPEGPELTLIRGWSASDGEDGTFIAIQHGPRAGCVERQRRWLMKMIMRIMQARGGRSRRTSRR
jgi:hypothetical protein